jgi:hypothetical protein
LYSFEIAKYLETVHLFSTFGKLKQVMIDSKVDCIEEEEEVKKENEWFSRQSIT